MIKTISTHNGSVANREHNIRNPKVIANQDHIDKNLKIYNEILHDEKPREAYKRIFDEALRKYNQKQTRKDRKIKNYFSHIEKDAKKHTVYEMIVQIGNRYDTGVNAPKERVCLKEFYEGWKDRNPNLECIGAYIHADEKEGTLHMHIDYIPIATGYKKGMEIQNGLVKALEQQGFKKEGNKTAQIKWQFRENAVLEAICKKYGIIVKHLKDNKRKHLNTEIYKDQMKLKEIKKELLKASKILENKKNDMYVIENRKNLLESEILKLKTELIKTKEVLINIETQLKNKIEKSKDIIKKRTINEIINEAKKYADKENKISLIEKFIKLPEINPIWEKFYNKTNKIKYIEK